MGGTVNVITKLPQEFEASLKARMGSDDYLSYGGAIGNRFDKLSIRLGLEYDTELVGRATSYVFRPVSNGTSTLTGGRHSLNRAGADYWIAGDEGERNEEQWNGNLAAAYALEGGGTLRLESQVGRSNYRNGRPTSYIRDANGQPVFTGSVDVGSGRRVTIEPTQFLNGEGERTNASYMLTYSDTFSWMDLVAKAGYQHEDQWYTTVNSNSGDFDTATGIVREFKTDTYFMDVQSIIPLGTSHTLVAGLYFRGNDFDQGQFDVASYHDERSKLGGMTEFTQGTDRYYALYVQDEITLTSALTAFIGARYDTWEAYDGRSGAVSNPLNLADTDNSAFSPSASLVWTVNDSTVLRAAISKAFSAPNLYDLYRTYASNNRLNLSNPDLKPETLTNYEIGLVQYLWDKRLRLSVTGFQMDYQDLVYGYTTLDVNDIDNNPVTTIISTNTNAGRARNRGFELIANMKVLDWLNVWANYSENHTRITKNETAPNTVGKHFTYSPDRSANVGLDAHFDWLRASLIGSYTGRTFRTAENTDKVWGVYQTTSIGWLADLKLSADLPEHLLGRESTLSLSVKNLLDRDYFDFQIGQSRAWYVDYLVKF